MFGKGLLKGLGITFKHTFEKELTQQYPEERPILQERFRGCLAFDFAKCIACGLCTKACPNNVLSLETVKEEGVKKKKLQTYTIDLQYCLFCNVCVEVCPTNTLFFTHNFELTQFKRSDIKIVYQRPPELDIMPEDEKHNIPEAKPAERPDVSAADAKRLKQIEATETVLTRTPRKALAKLLASEEDIAVMSALLVSDDKKLSKLAELMIDDREKAAKIAQAWVNKDKKEQKKAGGEQK